MTPQSIDISGLDVIINSSRILDQVAIKAGTGRFVGIIGPNGSGKSTLIRCMSRTLQPVAGTVLVEGREISVFSRRELAEKLSVVPQESPRTFDYTVEEVVGMGRYAHQGLLSGFSVQDHEMCHAAMKTAGITHLSGRQITSLSGGEWQRVLIARTLAQDTPIILLDEPTSHLDISHQIEILCALQALSRNGITVVGVFHDLNLAAHFCDDIIVISQGRIAVTGAPRDVITPQVLKEYFNLDAIVRIHPSTGKPLVVPMFASPCAAREGACVHVICGGDTGSEILHALCLAGCRVTVGVLALNDSDYATASELNIPCIAESPFTPVSELSQVALAAMLRKADRIVVTPMPVGQGNLVNLRILAGSGSAPIRFLTAHERPEIIDFTGGAASAIIRDLAASSRLQAMSLEKVVKDCSGSGGTKP
jgi:iron complex transport system ATP-binding protein